MNHETHDPIQAFFDTYAAAFNASDIEVIAGSYAPGFIMTSATGAACNTNDAQFHDRLKKAAGFYQHIGMYSAKIAAFSENVLDAHHSLVKIQWELFREDGSELVNFDVSYLVRKGDNGPEIVLVIPHNEAENMQQKSLLPS